MITDAQILPGYTLIAETLFFFKTIIVPTDREFPSICTRCVFHPLTICER